MTGSATALHDPLDQREVGKPRNEEAVRASVGIGLAALDRLVGQSESCVSGLAFRNRSVRRLMKKSVPTPARRAASPRDLIGNVVEAVRSDHLVLEIAADRAGLGEAAGVRGQASRPTHSRLRNRPSPADRRAHDPRCIGERKVERHFLAVAEAVGHGDRGAAGRDRFRAGLGDGLRAAGDPTR